MGRQSVGAGSSGLGAPATRWSEPPAHAMERPAPLAPKLANTSSGGGRPILWYDSMVALPLT